MRRTGMFVIDLLLDDLAKEIKDAPGWLTLIIVCNVLLGSRVVLESIERRGFHIRDEKALIATLAAIVLFLLGDIVDILVFPRRKDAERWEKVLRDIMLTVLISGVFYVVGRKRLCFFVIFVVLWVIHSLRSNFRKNREEQEQKLKQKREKQESSQGAEKKQGWLKHFESGMLVEERKRAAASLKLKEDEYAVSKSLAQQKGEYNWRCVYFENEAAKFLRSLVFPALLLGVALLSQQQWVDAVFAIAAAVGFLESYFWLKQRHMISLYKGVQRILEDEKNSFAATLNNGRRVFFWNHHFAGSGKAANYAGYTGAEHPLVS